MPIQFSTAVRNAMLDAIEVATGASPSLRIYAGAVPASCADVPGSSPLVTMSLPADFYAAAASGSKVLSGSWTGTAAGGGTATFYRIYDAAGTTCHEQGTVGLAGSGADMIIDSAVIASTQVVTISAKTITAGNA